MDSTTTKFVALYDGPAHENHEIDIITLGHSLTALGTLLYETNDVLNGERSSIDVRINAEFIEGSFGFEVEVIQSLVNAKDILVPLGLLGGAAAGTVIGAINWLKGEEIIAVESADDSIEAQIYVNGDAVNCPKDVAALVSNPKIRNALEDIVRAPLMDEGTTTIAFKKDKQDDSPALQIDKAQSESFTRLSLTKIQEPDENVSARVKFIAADIKKKTGWRIELSGKDYVVKMEDQAFRDRLLNMEESYVFGRRFEVNLKTVVSRTMARSTTTRYITHVKSEVKQK